MEITFLPEQTESWGGTAPAYCHSSPYRLIWNDVTLGMKNLRYAYTLFFPWDFQSRDKLNELTLTPGNLLSFMLHMFIFLLQTLFVLTLPLCAWLPMATVLAYFVCVVVVNEVLCRLLNGNVKGKLMSNTDLTMFPQHRDEQWIFVNGVGTGKHWLQSNVNRLSLTFGRPVIGVHNPTNGIIFDFLQCLIQRSFRYVTPDSRYCYNLVKESILNPQFRRVVFIMHGQGAIEGSMILDWLFSEVPEDLTDKLEVFTFGSSATWFNNPLQRYSVPDTYGNVSNNKKKVAKRRAVRHIEHYANRTDVVARWGVLHFSLHDRRMPSSGEFIANRYSGRVFQYENGVGHQLNQHILNVMFPLDKQRGWGVLENNDFFDSYMLVPSDHAFSSSNPYRSDDYDRPNGMEDDRIGRLRTVRVKEVSRLWMYRSGKSPMD